MIYLCYIDESGTPSIPGNTSHYVLSGISIPIFQWKHCDMDIYKIKKRYGLEDCEFHTGWIMRKYIEQSSIKNFDKLGKDQRIYEVEKLRNKTLLDLQKTKNHNLYRQTKKNYKQTKSYIHLTYSDRVKFIQEVADIVGNWGFARIFGECVNKVHYNPAKTGQSVDEQAFEQLVTRFEHYLQIISKRKPGDDNCYGMLIHDNNETVSRKHTQLMKQFLYHGTLWTKIEKTIETPLFVNSELTSLIQVADLCSYSMRRFHENNEVDLIYRIKSRFDKKNQKYVGVRHFSDPTCGCFICNHVC
ncbi:MAG: DUF3800 domain-containing protein [Bacteroidota bacterium]